MRSQRWTKVMNESFRVSVLVLAVALSGEQLVEAKARVTLFTVVPSESRIVYHVVHKLHRVDGTSRARPKAEHASCQLVRRKYRSASRSGPLTQVTRTVTHMKRSGRGGTLSGGRTQGELRWDEHAHQLPSHKPEDL